MPPPATITVLRGGAARRHRAQSRRSSRQRPSTCCTGRSEKLKRMLSSRRGERERLPRRHDEDVAPAELEHLGADRRPAAAFEADVHGRVAAARRPGLEALRQALGEGADRRHRRAAGRRVDEAQLEAVVRIDARLRDAEQRFARAARTDRRRRASARAAAARGRAAAGSCRSGPARRLRARVAACDFAALFSAKPASRKRTSGMSRPSSQTTGSRPSLPWSWKVHDGVMMKSP